MTLYFFKARTITRDGVATQYPPRTEEEVLGDLKEFYEIFGRLPTYFDFKKSLAFGQSFPSSTMCKHFECGWDVLLKKAGLKVARKHVVRKSDKKMIRDLQKIYAELERPLVKTDIKGSHVASPASYSRRFGSFANACERAGVPYRYHLEKQMAAKHL